MKKRIIVTAAITACLALCAAVWPQTEKVEKTPTPPQSPAVSAPEATVAEREEKFEATPPSEKEKTESLQPEPPHETTNEPEPAPVEASVDSNARPTAESEHASEHPPRRRRSLICNPAIWSMWRASVGWNTKGQITANTARTFTKMGTKSASWADLKNCAA